MNAIILISADIEWQSIFRLIHPADCNESPFGEWFYAQVFTEGGRTGLRPLPAGPTALTYQDCLIFFHGGWGKVAAAASTQYAIDRWKPDILVNLGTCGGFSGLIDSGEIILVEKTIIYDIIEQMGDSDEHIDHYTTEIDLSWLKSPPPRPVLRSLLVSGDRDLLASEVDSLHDKYGAIAGDWESGAIAWVARRNNIPVLILRGVTDLVDSTGGEAYGNIEFFSKATHDMLDRLIADLPAWLGLLRATAGGNRGTL